ncbi:hypothetical protein HDU93_007385 [Gonapodya sp. JEL0774]|nr:hypothetical protein HDU93_007385 [Gonapodya sp. JEL0774]
MLIPSIPRPSTAIVAGTPASAAQYPWIARLITTLITAGSASQEFCTGVLVAATPYPVVLTAGHCRSRTANVVDARAMIGLQDSAAGCTGTCVEMLVLDVINHPQYTVDPASGLDITGHDVQLWVLDPSTAPASSLANLANSIAPINLDPNTPTAGQASQALGWGITNKGGTSGMFTLATTLQGTTLTAATSDQCVTYFGLNGVDQTLIGCASPATTAAGITTTCQGDSGGPHVVNGVVWATTSFGPVPCDNGGPVVVGDVIHNIKFHFISSKSRSLCSRHLSNYPVSPGSDMRGKKQQKEGRRTRDAEQESTAEEPSRSKAAENQILSWRSRSPARHLRPSWDVLVPTEVLARIIAFIGFSPTTKQPSLRAVARCWRDSHDWAVLDGVRKAFLTRTLSGQFDVGRLVPLACRAVGPVLGLTERGSETRARARKRRTVGIAEMWDDDAPIWTSEVFLNWLTSMAPRANFSSGFQLLYSWEGPFQERMPYSASVRVLLLLGILDLPLYRDNLVKWMNTLNSRTCYEVPMLSVVSGSRKSLSEIIRRFPPLAGYRDLASMYKIQQEDGTFAPGDWEGLDDSGILSLAYSTWYEGKATPYQDSPLYLLERDGNFHRMILSPKVALSGKVLTLRTLGLALAPSKEAYLYHRHEFERHNPPKFYTGGTPILALPDFANIAIECARLSPDYALYALFLHAVTDITPFTSKSYAEHYTQFARLIQLTRRGRTSDDLVLHSLAVHTSLWVMEQGSTDDGVERGSDFIQHTNLLRVVVPLGGDFVTGGLDPSRVDEKLRKLLQFLLDHTKDWRKVLVPALTGARKRKNTLQH